MNFSIEACDLYRIISRLQKSTDRSPRLGSYSSVLFTVDADDRLLIDATTGPVCSSVMTRPHTIASSGATCVDAAALRAALKNVPRGTIATLEKAAGDTLIVVFGDTRINLHCRPASQFPPCNHTPLRAAVTVSASLIAAAIKRVLPTISIDDGRPNLTGAHIKVTADGALELQSIDGHRATVARIPVMQTGHVDPILRDGAIVPRKALVEFLRLLDRAADAVEIGIVPPKEGDKHRLVELKTETVSVRGRIIDGTYPSFKNVVPIENPAAKVTVARKELLAKLRALEPFAGGYWEPTRSRAHRVSLVKGGAICLFAERTEIGARTETIAADGPAFGPTAVNCRYLIDLLACLDSPMVSLEIRGGLEGATIRAVYDGGSEVDAFSILMPLRG